MKQNKSEKPGTFYLEMLRSDIPKLAQLVVTHKLRQIVDYPICYGKLDGADGLVIGYDHPNAHSAQIKSAVIKFFS